MNSYTLTEKLRKARRNFSLSAGAQALFHELIAINNEERWANEFKCPAGELCAALRTSEKTLGVYREELIVAGLITYLSGKTRRCPSWYSLNGSRFGSTNGSKIYHPREHPTEHPMVVKTPDLIKHKEKDKEKHIEDVVDDIERAREINDAITDFCSTGLEPEKKEKSSAQKEKAAIPDVDEAERTLLRTYASKFELCLKQYKIDPGERKSLLELFWAMNVDNYNVRFPPWGDIMSHFYNWIPVHQAKNKPKTSQQTHNHGTFKIQPGDKQAERTRGAAAALGRLAGKFSGNNSQ